MILPVLKRLYDSRAKVENVVKPPHKPVLRKRTRRGLMFLFFRANAAITPMIKAPIIFVTSVLYGNELFSFNGIRLIKYLKIEPIKPPKPT